VGLTGANAPAGGYTINLVSSDPSIVTVPATVTIAQGNNVTSFTIVGKAVGTADVTASVGGYTVTNTVTVAKATFEWYNLVAQMTLGATLSFQVRTYVPNGNYYSTNGVKYALTYQNVDQAVTVSLSSENPAVIQVPATATITAGNYNSSSFNIQAVGTGASTLTAAASGWDSKTSGAITVVGPWMKADVVVGAGTRTTGVVGLTGANAPAGGYTINLVSSDPSIVTVPATVTIAQGNNVTSFTIVGKAVGTADVTASVGGYTVTNTVTVVKATFEWYNLASQMTLGTTLSFQVRTYVPNGNYYSTNGVKYALTYQSVDQAVTVSLSSENPAVIQVPASTTITAGNYNSSSFNIQAVGTGSSTLTAAASGWDSKTSGTITVP
jgi:plastocyanin